jgi:endogenous inhibitor of DNA gyrase (YacG/DUF329 family)
MISKCPNCGKSISYLKVSKHIEGKLLLNIEPQLPLEWKPSEDQLEPEIYTCPECHTDIDDETLKEWGVLWKAR